MLGRLILLQRRGLRSYIFMNLFPGFWIRETGAAVVPCSEEAMQARRFTRLGSMILLLFAAGLPTA